MNNSTFRADFPEFTSVIKFPEATVTFYAAIGEKLINECRWGEMKPFGVELFVAHNITLAKMNTNASDVDGLPGQSLGPATSKAIGEVSVSYDSTSSLEEKAGHWNLTTYGKQFIRLAKMFGMGAIQL